MKKYFPQKFLALICVLGNTPYLVEFAWKSLLEKRYNVILLIIGLILYVSGMIAVAWVSTRRFEGRNQYILWIVYSLYGLLLIINYSHLLVPLDSFLFWCAEMVGNTSLLLPGVHLYFQVWARQKYSLADSS